MAQMAKYKEKILDEFKVRTDEWTYGTFENRLLEVKKGSSYHDAKTVIIDAHENGNYNNVVKQYLLTNYRSFGNVSGEFNKIFNSIWNNLSEDEKKNWEPIK